MGERLKIEYPTQGSEQFLAYRREILDAYDQAKAKTKSNKVKTEHGRVAEARVRNWLARACPQLSQISPAVRWMAARKLRAVLS